MTALSPPIGVDLGSLESVIARMCQEFDVAEEGVRDLAAGLVQQFADARVTAYVPLLIERRLRDYARRARDTSRAG